MHNEYQIFGTALPFLGRRAQMETLARELQTAAQTRSARYVTVLGSGGVGKSRMTHEFVEALVSQGHDIKSYWTSFSHRKLEPGFAPLTQIVRQQFGIRAEDKDELARDKLVSGLVELVDGSRLNDAAHLLGALLQLPFAFEFGDMEKEDLSKFMERAYQTCLNLVLLDNCPVVLVIDNIDAASNTISEWFPALTASLSQAPVLIVLIGQDSQQVPVLPQEFTEGSSIELAALENPDILRTVSGFLGCVPEALDATLADSILSRVKGNPRNVEQILRLMVQNRVITASPDGWTFSPRRLAEANLPDDMRGIARERISMLPDNEREVLEVAAVLGSPFWTSGVQSMVAAIAPVSAEADAPWDMVQSLAIGEKLQVLRDLEMIAESGGAALRGEEEFIFVNPGERREAIDMLAPDKRNLLHRLAAQWMAKTEPNEQSIWNLAISRQFQASGSSIGEARHLVRAANHARRAFNNRLAVRLYEEAIHLMGVDQAALKLEACAKLAWTHRMMGTMESASSLYLECLRLAHVLNDQHEVARVLSQMGSVEMEEGRYEKAQTMLLESLSLYQQLQDLAGVASVRDDLGQLLWHVGAKNAYEEATSQFEQSLALRRELGDERAVARCLTRLGHMDLSRGNWREAEDRYRAALSIRKKNGDIRGQAISMNGIANLFFERMEYKKATQVWQEVERLARSIGDQGILAIALINLARAYLIQNDLEQAEENLERAENMTDAALNIRIYTQGQRVGADLAIAKGQFERAEQHCARAMAAAEASGNRTLTAITLSARASLGIAQFVEGEHAKGAKAEIDILRAISLFEEMGDTLELEGALLIRAKLERARGQEENARAIENRVHQIRSHVGGRVATA